MVAVGRGDALATRIYAEGVIKLDPASRAEDVPAGVDAIS
jgi:hypothetical protein